MDDDSSSPVYLCQLAHRHVWQLLSCAVCAPLIMTLLSSDVRGYCPTKKLTWPSVSKGRWVLSIPSSSRVGRRFFRRESTTEEDARHLAVQRRIEALVRHLDESANWQHFVPGADRAWQGQFVWDKDDPEKVTVFNAGILLSLEVSNAAVPALVPPILPNQGEQITIRESDIWCYQDYGAVTRGRSKVVESTEWLLSDKNAPREPPFFVIFHLAGPDGDFASSPHPPLSEEERKPPSYFYDHSKASRVNLRPVAPPYTKRSEHPRRTFTEPEKEVFALRVEAFVGEYGREVRFRGKSASDVPLKIQYPAGKDSVVTISNAGAWRPVVPSIRTSATDFVPLLAHLESCVEVFAFVLPGSERGDSGTVKVRYRGNGWDSRLSALRCDRWVYQRRSGLSHENRPAALHHATETDWVVTSSGGSKQSIDVRFVAPTNPFEPEERGPSDARTAHVFSVGKRRLMTQRARRIE